MSQDRIILEDVSKFYGEVLGVNHITVSIGPGITSLVGPSGSGKTTLMNLITGLIRPSRGKVSVLGIPPSRPQHLMRLVGYATQFDAFPKGLTGMEFICSFLRMAGYTAAASRQMAARAIEQVGMTADAHRRLATYSKGMRQRIKLAFAIAHNPPVLVLDEPLNGLDPLIRASNISMFKEWAKTGRYVIVSSHVLQEVDMISDQVVLLCGGYVAAEGQIRGVRSEIQDRPMQFLVRTPNPRKLAARLLQEDCVVEVQLIPEGGGIMVKTTNQERFWRAIPRIGSTDLRIEGLRPTDDNLGSVYQYLVDPQEPGI